MKNFIVVVGLLFGIMGVSLSSISSHPICPIQNCNPIIDSATVFLETSKFAVNLKPTIRDRARNHRLDLWLRKAPYSDFKCLLESKSIPLIALGFVYAEQYHKDSVMKNYSRFLKDETPVQYFMADGSKSKKVTLGVLLTAMIEKKVK